MSEVMRFIKGDHTNTVQWTCTDENGSAIDLTNVSTVTIKIGRLGESSNLVEKTGTAVSPKSSGVAQFTFDDTDLSSEGYFDVHIELDYSSGAHKTLRYMDIHILPDM